MNKAFTLIELLIVVAIIAILAAIAVPNFLEAQTRAKISRAKADMRSILTAVESYRVDAGRTPPPFEKMYANGATEWWGFVPMRLTTPIAYMTSLPIMPFFDEYVSQAWTTFTGGQGTKGNQPYTYYYDLSLYTKNPRYYGTAPISLGITKGMTIPNPYLPQDGLDVCQKMLQSSFLLNCSGADKAEGVVYLSPIAYDPSNGTVSYGDIQCFGGGSPPKR